MTGAAPDPADRWWASRIEESVIRDGYLRRSPASVGGADDHKEWFHFVVHSDEVDVLVNFSLVDDVRPGASGLEFPRIVVLARTRDGSWDGAIEDFGADETEIHGGQVDLRFGRNRVHFRDGRYHIQVSLTHRPIELDLRLRPITLPAHFNNVRLQAGDRPIHWTFLPRLVADGTVRMGGERFELRGDPAYHDHDWGHFRWGRDFAWEWGSSLPSSERNPWSLVFVRMSDRGRHRVYTQAVFLWRRESPHRIFRDHEIGIATRGFLRAKSVFKLPPVMGLVAPGTAADIPARLEVSAEGRGDQLHFSFESEDVGQVCIPNDTHHEGVTIINEVAGRLAVEGEVRGERVEMQGYSMFEFVRGG